MKGNTMSQAPTATQLFGPTLFATDIGGTSAAGPFLYAQNLFATPETAAVVLQIVTLGCKLQPGDCKIVERTIAPQTPTVKQNVPNLMILMPDGSVHYAGLIAFEFLVIPSIETINADLTQELGMPFVFVMPPPPAKLEPKPVPGHELLVAPIGGTAMQADGTTWKRVS